ncbi:WXG100 family type VII secretion target [Couchioplanes caeruleus]|uniref:WXG100 family type VII secretion target n=2 Tax=Couchioplanes caeruleus TaxID=56438 RepID=A0A1K0FIB2_9ACTN|nr:WXG100 family type VII secretion target [Couchioplanes caeruleus]OJF12583.1 hypothetical protein BG844_19865 [Couchioplanes caeruleus subsp. caeruleus]ROP33514.1 uncharacterized protein YukE [Couchioplanes caeruleus]
MILSVEPSALTSYARQLDRAREDVSTIKAYIAKNAEGGTGGELISIAREGHTHAVEVIDGTFYRLACLLETSSPELDKAADYYQRTDLVAAARVDGTLPPGRGQCPTPLEYELASNVCKPGLFADPRFPESHLKPPPEPENPSNPLGWMDYLSLSSWAAKGCDIIFGFDPIGEMQEKLFGDWEALASMQAVLTNSGSALHDLAANIQSGATTLQSTWRGNAGDTAYRYFTDLATAVDALKDPLNKIGEAYRVMAESVWAAGEAVGGALKGLIDSAVVAGIAAAAGTITAETGVGAVVGYGIAGVEVANMLRLWGEATKFAQNATAAVLLFRSVLTGTLSDLEMVKLPVIGGGAGYDHPLAGAGQHG